jgi:recombinational DNA repair ATPase RecF
VEFDAGPITVLFGKNNAGKTNILEAAFEFGAIGL